MSTWCQCIWWLRYSTFPLSRKDVQNAPKSLHTSCRCLSRNSVATAQVNRQNTRSSRIQCTSLPWIILNPWTLGLWDFASNVWHGCISSLHFFPNNQIQELRCRSKRGSRTAWRSLQVQDRARSCGKKWVYSHVRCWFAFCLRRKGRGKEQLRKDPWWVPKGVVAHGVEAETKEPPMTWSETQRRKERRKERRQRSISSRCSNDWNSSVSPISPISSESNEFKIGLSKSVVISSIVCLEISKPGKKITPDLPSCRAAARPLARSKKKFPRRPWTQI